jgi:hypothetical protein
MAKRFVVPIVAGLLSVLFSTGCLTLTQGTHQTIPAVSRPAGVRVIVDGKPAGTTPVNLELTRRNIHAIRFELDGYRPVEISLKRENYNFLAAVIGNLALMPAGYIILGVPLNAIWADEAKIELGAIAPYLTGALIAWIGGTLIDMSLPSNRELEPHTLSITMEKDDGRGGPLIVEMDADRLRGLRWISVAVE